MKAETIRQRKKFALEQAERGDRVEKPPRRGKNSPPPDVISQPKGYGLAIWRKRQAEEKAAQVAALDRLRESTMVEVRDGRTFSVVQIPDRYEWLSPPTGGPSP